MRGRLRGARVKSGDRDAVAELIPLVLERLQQLSPQQAQIAELRYFGGLSVEESAEVLSVSPRTVKRGRDSERHGSRPSTRAAAGEFRTSRDGPSWGAADSDFCGGR